MKKILITGVSGQDGRHLAEQLGAQDGVRIVGQTRSYARATQLFSSVLASPNADVLRIEECDLCDAQAFTSLLSTHAFDEIYHLAAPTVVEASWNDPIGTLRSMAEPLHSILRYLRDDNPNARLFFAASSEIFGQPRESPQTEITSVAPRNPYGAAKAYAYQMVQWFRARYGCFAASGILYNHEGPYRPSTFVTMKICLGVARYRVRGEPFLIGNLDARRDWGSAEDFMRALPMILSLPEPQDFVVSTGETKSVRDFVEACSAAAGVVIEWQGKGFEERGVDAATGALVLSVDPGFYRPAEETQLIGDSRRLREVTGWNPRVGFREMVADMYASAKASI